MEHNLGMTCDPIAGLVQIPCIERNAMGALKAVNACRMAMHETEGHKLSLGEAIEIHGVVHKFYRIESGDNFFVRGDICSGKISCSPTSRCTKNGAIPNSAIKALD